MKCPGSTAAIERLLSESGAATVAIAPHALTAETLPAEGARIGYTGLAFYGEDFAEHGYISCPLDVTEHTAGNAPGFYATVVEGGDEVFVLVGDDGTQTLHGYMLLPSAAPAEVVA